MGAAAGCLFRFGGWAEGKTLKTPVRIWRNGTELRPGFIPGVGLGVWWAAAGGGGGTGTGKKRNGARPEWNGIATQV
jgi:hypothetical protein